jgi:glycosyltransferase involved in cell wall biosynthesis
MDKTIRVLHTEWSDGWGGQEIRIIDEMLAVREQGVEVFLACRDHAVIKQKAEENKIKVIALPFRGSFDLKTFFLLKEFIKEHRIDIVNTHSGKDTWVGGFAAKRAGVKFIRTRHLSNKIRTSRLNFINELADYIITTGESVRTDMIKFNRIKSEKIQSIPTGVDSNIFDPASYDRAECRKRFNLKDGEIAIGVVAVLRKFKRHDYFVEAAKNVRNKIPESKFRFFIAGDGPLTDFIEDYIKGVGMGDHIELLGHVDDVPELLAALDIIALTSDSNEGVPQSIIQALMMKKLVTATNVGSTRDLIINNNLLIVPPLVDKITESLITLVRSYNFEKENRHADREFMIERFSKQMMKENVTGIYKLLTGRDC